MMDYSLLLWIRTAAFAYLRKIIFKEIQLNLSNGNSMEREEHMKLKLLPLLLEKA